MSRMTREAGEVRNLDEIQEDEPQSGAGRVGALVLASLGGACIVFAAIVLVRSPKVEKTQPVDPLGELVAKQRPAGAEPKREAPLSDVSFPSVLSDQARPTTALEVVRSVPSQAPIAPPGIEPPPATDRLPVVPLPAQHVLEPGAPQVLARDQLASMAKQVSREEGREVAVGMGGGYQLQVSSFKVASEAETFAAALRRRGHHAYVESAEVMGRGTWHRVRIGPFKSKHSAVLYRQDFEAKERLVTFIVDAPKKMVASKGDATKLDASPAGHMRVSE